MAANFLEDSQGNKSNSRLMADIMIFFGLLMSLLLMIIGVFKPDVDLMKIATAVGVLFGAIAGTSMTFLFFQKQSEVKQDIAESKDQFLTKEK